MRTRLLLLAAIAIGCGRDTPAPVPAAEPESAVAVHATASRAADSVVLRLRGAARAADGLEEITYPTGATQGLLVRAAGARIAVRGERYLPTLSGGDVEVTLAAVPAAATELELAGAVVYRNPDGSELARAPLPPRVSLAVE